MNENQKWFIKRHLSQFIPPFLLLGFGFLVLPLSFHFDSREDTVELQGVLSSLKLIRASADQDNVFEFKVREYPNSFIVSKLPVADQLLLTKVEKIGNDVKFKVEKNRLDRGESQIPVLALKSYQNVYLREHDIGSIMQTNRIVAFILSVPSLFLGFRFSRRLKTLYQTEIANRNLPERVDPLLVFLAQSPRRFAGISAFILYMVLAISLRKGAWPIALAISVGAYLVFEVWFRKKGSQSEFFQKIVETDAANKKMERVATTAPTHVKAVELLLKSGHSVDAQNEGGQTALHIAAMGGHTEAIDLLVRSGATIDMGDINGNSPLMLAAKGNSLGAVQKLVELGADVLRKNPSGQAPLDFAQRSKNKAIIEFMTKKIAEAEAKAKAQAEKEALEKEQKAAQLKKAEKKKSEG